jgi:Gpi18-like mannosyltransferase
MDPAMEYFKENQTTLDVAPSTAIGSMDEAAAAHRETKASLSEWPKWFNAIKQILPIYISLHLAFLFLTYLSVLFIVKNFSNSTLHISTLWRAWYRWDTGQITAIATNGYTDAWRTAFFPLFPLLERGGAFLTRDPFIAGLIISNLAGLGMLVVLYRLVQEEFDAERAFRTVLYLSVFPTAFFFVAAYNESLFLLLTLLSFYQMRHGNWWLASLFGLLASLTRSAGIVLFLPFCYEYLRQHQFTIKKIRFALVSSLGIPAGIGIFALYCYYKFHDPLAFSQAQAHWARHLHAPWTGLINSFLVILNGHVLSFDSIHNVIDLSASLFILGLVVLCFVGPWKFPRAYRVYVLYAVLIYIYSVIFPLDVTSNTPLAAFSRYMLEVFPAFIVLAAIGKKQWVNLYYLVLSVSILSFMLLQFLIGRWII